VTTGSRPLSARPRIAPPVLPTRSGGFAAARPPARPSHAPGGGWPTPPAVAEPLRRTPSQHRSRLRVERILDAAGDLVAERGYESATTSLIARRARVSPGSFYQFFADKRSVVQAVAARNLGVFVERLEEVMAAGQLPDWWDAVEAALEHYVELCRTRPGFRAVRFGDVVDAHLLDPEVDNDTVVAARIAALLGARFGVVDSTDLRLALVVAVKVADTLVNFAFSRDAAGDPEVLEQARRMVRCHLESHVRSDGSSG
jgi:AcrR family transcriptional regulator